MENIIFELRRKLVHISSVIYIILYYFINEFFSHRTAIYSLVFILIALSFMEFLKMKYSKKIPFFHKLYRDNEKNTLSGSIFLLLGIIIAFSAFEFNIAITAILMMIFGDAASGLMTMIGNHKIEHLSTSWEGIIAEFLIDIAVGFIFLSNIPVIFLMALTATIVETLLKPVDDNLAVPIVSGFAGESLLILLRIFGFL